MTSDSIWIILCYSGIILYAVCSSGFHAEGFLNALTCFSMFLRWNPCIYTEARPCSASFSSDSFSLSKACSAEDLLPSKARSLIFADTISAYVQKLKYQQDLPEALSEACLSLERADTKSLTVLHYGNLTRVLFRDIVYIQKAHRSLSIYTTEQGMIQDNRGLKELYGVLNDSRFIFTDRSYLVNIDFARQIEGYWMILKGGKKVPISRPMMPSVKQAIIRLCEG